jgi:hypothetical protein
MGTTPNPLPKNTQKATVAMIEALRVLRTTRQDGDVQRTLRAAIERNLTQRQELPDHIPQALVACGDRALLERVRAAHVEAGTGKAFSSIVLSGSNWSGLLEQGLEGVLHLLDTDANPPIVSARNASLPVLEWVINHPRDLEGERLLAVLARKDRKAYHLLEPRAAGLFFQEHRARVGADFLTAWMVHHASVARELGKNWAGNGNAFGVMALHLAGLPLGDMQSWNRAFHPSVAPVFGPTSAHHQMALRAHARSLAHLLEHRKAFEDWAADVLAQHKPAPQRKR